MSAIEQEAPPHPEGFVGSVTHTDAFAAAIVAHSPPAPWASASTWKRTR
jgi:4'-phosphopantetheinyl transferase EntD